MSSIIVTEVDFTTKQTNNVQHLQQVVKEISKKNSESCHSQNRKEWILTNKEQYVIKTTGTFVDRN